MVASKRTFAEICNLIPYTPGSLKEYDRLQEEEKKLKNANVVPDILPTPCEDSLKEYDRLQESEKK